MAVNCAALLGKQVVAAVDVRDLLERHMHYTDSLRARAMLDDWDRTLSLFVKVMPMEYRRALGRMSEVEIDARRTAQEIVSQG